MFDLSGRIAVVTGGGSGIGRAIAVLLARQGAAACILEVNTAAAEEVVREIRGDGGDALVLGCDVSNRSRVREVFAEIHDRHGSIDVLVNNAGIAHIGTVESTSEEDFDRVWEVNVKGVYHCINAALPYMKTQRRGSIINVGSVAAMVGIADRFAYSTSKGAVLGMTYSVAKDCLAYGIRCNSVAPARVHTPFVDGYLKAHYPDRQEEMFEKLSRTQPIGRMGRPEEIAALVLYLASDEASFITGANLPIDGGFTTLNT